MAVDLGEDSILALMLTYPETITDSLVSTLKGLTIVKLGCVTAAAAQTLGFLILSVGKAAAGHF